MKIGIIGLGDGGCSNLRSLKMVGADVVAACDPNEAARQAVRVEVGDCITLYSNAQELLARSDVELAVIATPDNQHLEVTSDALSAGKRVFVEKPVATSHEDLNAFCLLAKEYPKQILFSEKYSFAYPIEAALARRSELGGFMCGTTLYTMWNCGRIMGDGKWRTEHDYNPCAGGLSHNFMTALLFSNSLIARVRATGQVLTYHKNLKKYGGYDTMEGTIEFTSGRRLNWFVCLAVKGRDSLFAHRTITHYLQFEKGALAYGPTREGDRLILNGEMIPSHMEPSADEWSTYNFGTLYGNMYRDLFSSIEHGGDPRHNIFQGINVAYACRLAFESAKEDGAWMTVPNHGA